MQISSHNEWDPLRAVIVGTVEGFVAGLEYHQAASAEKQASARALARQAFPQWYLNEVAEDLEGLCAIFRRAGIDVIRPRWSEPEAGFKTPNWEAEGFDIYNVRDLHLVVGNTLIASAPSSRFRLFEQYALRDLLYEHFFDEGFRWIAAPTPRLRGEYRHDQGSATELE